MIGGREIIAICCCRVANATSVEMFVGRVSRVADRRMNKRVDSVRYACHTQATSVSPWCGKPDEKLSGVSISLGLGDHAAYYFMQMD